MKYRVIKDGFRFKCQYKKYLFWRTFKDRTLNKRSNLKVWFGQFEPADKWIREYVRTQHSKKERFIITKIQYEN